MSRPDQHAPIFPIYTHHCIQRTRRARACGMAVAATVGALGIATPLLAADIEWNGAPGTPLAYTNPANWVGNVAPQQDDSLVFPASATTGKSVTFDSNAATRYRSITIYDAYTLSGGNAITLLEGVTMNGTTGEANSFSVDERIELLEAALSAGLPRERLLVGTGCCALSDTVRLTRHALSLGIGGYQPRTPAQVMETQYGDCKDKATLFIALARRMGVNAYPVLLSSTGGVERGLPSISQFDHMIAAVEKPRFLINARRANRKSLRRSSIRRNPRLARLSSLYFSIEPNSMRA